MLISNEMSKTNCEDFRGAMMDQHAEHCPFPHNVASGRPRLGVSTLIPSQNPRPILDLLGVTDKEMQAQMAKDHPYVFKKETEPSFLPAAHLPKEPGVVDMSRKRKQDEVECPAVLQQLNMSPGAAKEAPEARR